MTCLICGPQHYQRRQQCFIGVHHRHHHSLPPPNILLVPNSLVTASFHPGPFAATCTVILLPWAQVQFKLTAQPHTGVVAVHWVWQVRLAAFAKARLVHAEACGLDIQVCIHSFHFTHTRLIDFSPPHAQSLDVSNMMPADCVAAGASPPHGHPTWPERPHPEPTLNPEP